VSTAEDQALDALARALAPRVLKLIREEAGGDDDLRALLESAGFEIDTDAPANADARKGAA